jgi:hypothetical protein
MDEFIFILELIGTVAFASSGAMIAIEKKMDIFGVNVLGANCGRWRDHAGYHTRIDAAGGVFASGLCSCGGADIDDSFCDRICETDGF